MHEPFAQKSLVHCHSTVMSPLVLLAIGMLGFVGAWPASAQPARVKLRLTMLTSIDGTSNWDWMQARTAYIPHEPPRWLTTMSKTGKTGAHSYHDIFQSVSTDGGRSWSQPTIIESLGRASQEDGYEVVTGDLWPKYHAATGTVLTTGKTFNFAGGTKENYLREQVSYAVMDPKTGVWGPLRLLEMPQQDHSASPIHAPNAGCNQRVDLPNGEVLLPVRYVRDPKKRNYTSIVVRCRFDGSTLTYLEHGSEHNIPTGRGLYEPSLAHWGGEFFLTLRADDTAYVTKGADGVHFAPVKEWTFDDGSKLGSYNTQQHWVMVGGGLLLVYTRRGTDNDHIMRHRAPLFIAQVDPERLVVLRDTERILLPENDATLGNSGVCHISDTESWVTCGEGNVSLGKRKGENNKVLIVRITADQ